MNAVLRSSTCALLSALACLAQGPATAKSEFTKSQQLGCDFLMAQQKDGKFLVKMGKREFADPGFTSLALAALLSKPKEQRTTAERDCIEKGARFVLESQNADGSVGQQVPNYTTCAAVMALSRWGGEGSAEALAKAQQYVLAIQNCETNGKARSDVEYGGVGYGSKGERSDLSNLQFGVEALRNTKLPVNHEAFARAIVFLQRTQNLDAVNDLGGKLEIPGPDKKPVKLAVGKDGGAVYYPGESPAGYVDQPDGARMPRSYGSMTYALLKTYTLCGLKADDPRVQAAVKWIGANWTVAENPGADAKLGEAARYQGLYYYYMLLAQALDAAGIERVATQDKDGKAAGADWRKELRARLESLQRKDGSWLNDRNDRWYEGLDILCTCYALLALEHCR